MTASVPQTLFAVLICVQFVVMAVHDLVNIPGWAHGRQMIAALGRTKVWVGTALNSLLPGLAAFYSLHYWHRPKPGFVLNYWLIYCGWTVFGATMAWWVPYFRGTDQKTKDLYAKMYAGTRQVLPAHGDNPRPNLLHLYFHVLFLATFILSIILRLRIA